MSCNIIFPLCIIISLVTVSMFRACEWLYVLAQLVKNLSSKSFSIVYVVQNKWSKANDSSKIPLETNTDKQRHLHTWIHILTMNVSQSIEKVLSVAYRSAERHERHCTKTDYPTWWYFVSLICFFPLTLFPQNVSLLRFWLVVCYSFKHIFFFSLFVLVLYWSHTDMVLSLSRHKFLIPQKLAKLLLWKPIWSMYCD